MRRTASGSSAGVIVTSWPRASKRRNGSVPRKLNRPTFSPPMTLSNRNDPPGRSIRRSVKRSYDRFHDFERTMQLNYFGALKLILAFMPGMRERKSGHIINVSSIASEKGLPGATVYGATKGVLDQVTRVHAIELAPRKIRVNTILPGLLLTEWGKKYSPERIEALKAAAPLKKATDLEDCVDAFLMLAKNSSMTGMRVQVDAGLNVQGA